MVSDPGRWAVGAFLGKGELPSRGYKVSDLQSEKVLKICHHNANILSPFYAECWFCFVFLPQGRIKVTFRANVSIYYV